MENVDYFKRVIVVPFMLFSMIMAYSQSISVSSFKLLDSDLTANTAGTMEQDQNGEVAALIKVVTTQTGFSFDGGAMGVVKTKQTPGEIWVYVPRGSKKITIKHPQLGVLRDYFYPVSIESARTYEMILVAGTVQTIVQQARTSQYVVFQLTPPNAIVELDGSLLQTTDGTATKMMKFGSYDYRVQAPNYFPEVGKVTVNDPDNKKIVNVSLKPNFSKVTVKVDNNAEIWINGEKKGNGTWTGDLGEGTYEFEAKLHGHRKTLLTRDLVVTQEPQTINLQTPTPIYGEADINSSPAMADIYIDGQKVGQTPQMVSKLLIGSHQIRLSKKGYSDYSSTINIIEDVTETISAKLDKINVSQNIEEQTIDESTQDLTVSNLSNLKKKYKKNPVQLASIGRKLFEKKDLDNARVFAEMALSASKGRLSSAFILLGDIEAFSDNYGGAATQYEQAIYVDPKNPDAYNKYANVYRKISPAGAVAKLNELRQQRPDIAVDALAGRIYYMSNEFDKALAAYDKADMSKMEERDLSDYAMSAFFKQKYDKALEVAKFGLSKNPRHAAFNRLAFFNSTELKNFDDALMYADALFNKSDSAKFSYYDYTYYGNALIGAKQPQKAIEMYELALKQEDMDNKAKRAGVVKQLSDAYRDMDDFPNAIIYYKDYLSNNERPSANDVAGLASLYLQYSSTLKDEAKVEAFKMADETYADLAQKYENAAEYATFMRARVNGQLDPDQSKGLAKPFYEKLVELIGPKTDLDNTEKARLKESYHYLISYYFIHNKISTARDYAAKMLIIDPQNEIAKQVMEMK